jgi:hypothetical protein
LLRADQGLLDLAEIYQADLATIGVKLAIQELPAVDFLTRLQTVGFGSAWLTTMGAMNLTGDVPE